MTVETDVTRRMHLRRLVAGAAGGLFSFATIRSAAASAGEAGGSEMTAHEAAAIKSSCQRYLDAFYAGDSRLMEGLFHEKALIFGRIGQEDWVGDFSALGGLCDDNPPGRESGMTGDLEVLSLTGYSAAVQVNVRDYHGSDSIEFFALQKIDSEWKIVGKSFTSG